MAKCRPATKRWWTTKLPRLKFFELLFILLYIVYFLSHTYVCPLKIFLPYHDMLSSCGPGQVRDFFFQRPLRFLQGPVRLFLDCPRFDVPLYFLISVQNLGRGASAESPWSSSLGRGRVAPPRIHHLHDQFSTDWDSKTSLITKLLQKY